MLIEFKTKNYKSFSEELIFSMRVAPRLTDLKYSVLESSSKKNKALCSSVIYGANASGKSNIISAIDTFSKIIKRGNILNAINNDNDKNIASGNLELIPNCNNKSNENTFFSIEIFNEEKLYKYELEAYFGEFLEKNANRFIKNEKFYIDNKTIFIREDNELDITINNLDYSNTNEIKNIIPLLSKNLEKDELFLTNGFKNIIEQKVVSPFLNWINEKLIIIYHCDCKEVVPVVEKDKSRIVNNKFLDESARIFGINSNDLLYFSPENEDKAKLCSVFKLKNDRVSLIPAELFESYGTIRFMNIFPILTRAFSIDSTLIIDEFDASIHPNAIKNIIKIYHNDEININKAQLIFNTHNPTFLKNDLFRRDEIKFVEREESSHNSEHYSLSDFGTEGSQGVRKNGDFENQYLNYHFGAIRDVDLSDLFLKIANSKGENKNAQKIN